MALKYLRLNQLFNVDELPHLLFWPDRLWLQSCLKIQISERFFTCLSIIGLYNLLHWVVSNQRMVFRDFETQAIAGKTIIDGLLPHGRPFGV
jgi:hypothetical protein